MARYIDAEKLCDSLRESYNRLFELYKKAKDNDAATICEAELNTFMECIIRAKTQPTADVEEVKHGAWKKSQFSGRSGFYSVRDVICSKCGIYSTFLQHEIRPDYYCPNCGAKMDGGKAE